MARRTALDYIAEVRTAAGGPDTTRIPDARILRILNEERAGTLSKYYVAQMISSFSFASEAGRADYPHWGTDWPSNLSKIIIVKDNLGAELKETDSIDVVRGGVTTTGVPDSWYWAYSVTYGANQIMLVPAPAVAGNTYTVYYQSDPVDLVLAPVPTAETLPRVWDEVWMNKTIGKVMMVLGESSGAAPWIQLGAQAEQAAAQTLRVSDQPSRFQTELEYKMSLGNRY